MLFRNRSGNGRAPLTDDYGRQIVVLEDGGTNGQTGSGDSKITAATMPTGGSGMLGWLSAIWYQMTRGPQTSANSQSVTPASDAVFAVGATSNPTGGPLTRPNDTNAYAAYDLVANNTAAGSVVVPSFTAARIAAGSFSLSKIILLTNHTTGWSGISVIVRLWSAAPTYTNGDNGAYAVATGAAGFLGKFSGFFEQFADGAAAQLTPAVGGFDAIKLASGQTVYWDLQVVGAPATQSGKTFTLIPQLLQD